MFLLCLLLLLLQSHTYSHSRCADVVTKMAHTTRRPIKDLIVRPSATARPASWSAAWSALDQTVMRMSGTPPACDATIIGRCRRRGWTIVDILGKRKE